MTPLSSDSDSARYCSKCGNLNHDVEDRVLDCGHSLDDGAWLVPLDEIEHGSDAGSGQMGESPTKTAALIAEGDEENAAEEQRLRESAGPNT